MQKLYLTPTEAIILHELKSRPVSTTTDLGYCCYGDEGNKPLYEHIRTMKKKGLKIRTVRGVGWTLSEHPRDNIPGAVCRQFMEMAESGASLGEIVESLWPSAERKNGRVNAHNLTTKLRRYGARIRIEYNSDSIKFDGWDYDEAPALDDFEIDFERAEKVGALVSL